MTSDGAFPRRFTRIDDLTRRDHRYLTEEDDCYFIGEYTARRGYAYSETNHLILNFKKSPDRRGRPEWRYKEEAIRRAAAAFRTALAPDRVDRWTFVPIPPSKARGHPLHDDRITRMLRAIRRDSPLDVRELIVQDESVDASHGGGARPGPGRIGTLYRIDERSAAPPPDGAIIVDDVLTTGAHFRAAKSVLSARFPKAPVLGLFIARRAPDTFDV